MKGKLGILFMCLGTVLLVMALSLFLYNREEAQAAQQSAVTLLPQLIQKIEEAEAVTEPDGETRPVVLPGTPEALIDPAAFEMTEVEIDGHSYIGYLSIHAYDIELPIMADWSYPKLKIAPCRYYGTVLSEDLVLMAHNYTGHFGNLKGLPIGSEVSFTDMDGRITRYAVVAVEVLPSTAVEDMVAGQFDLTLFTCTYGGASRVAVRCDRVEV